MNDDWPDFPVILGQGSAHYISDDAGGRVYGEKGARIRVRVKRGPLGFKVPPPPKR